LAGGYGKYPAIPRSEISPEIVELKRNQLLLLRAITPPKKGKPCTPQRLAA
jgi:hypothetical protein